MTFIVVLAVSCLATLILGNPPQPRTTIDEGYPFPFVCREAWGAKPPMSISNLNTPVPFVVIHHTYIPGVCITRTQCERYMRSMQKSHQDTNGWADIGYNFAVGGEGSVYEGRGWRSVGAHAVGYNSQSIGIVLIGNFVSEVPSKKQLQTAKDLINVGVCRGFIRSDYKLIAHRQASPTECPGDALFKEISTWNHFTTDLQ